MTEHAKKEGIVPTGALDFLAHRYGRRMCPDEVECELADDCKVLGSMVFPGSVAVFVEDDIEHPMQLVLDGPMAAHDLQKFFGREVFGKQIVACERALGTTAVQTTG